MSVAYLLSQNQRSIQSRHAEPDADLIKNLAYTAFLLCPQSTCLGGDGPFGWAAAGLGAAVPVLVPDACPPVGALTTSPQKEGAAVADLFHGLLAS